MEGWLIACEVVPLLRRMLLDVDIKRLLRAYIKEVIKPADKCRLWKVEISLYVP